MADLKKCDRCGAIFEPNKSVQVEATVGYKLLMPAYITYANYTSDHCSGWDLCPNCVRAFQMFMKPSKGVNSND